MNNRNIDEAINKVSDNKLTDSPNSEIKVRIIDLTLTKKPSPPPKQSEEKLTFLQRLKAANNCQETVLHNSTCGSSNYLQNTAPSQISSIKI
jgi:hypothetical protein